MRSALSLRGLLAAAALLTQACGSAPETSTLEGTPDPLAAVAIPDLDPWTDKYHDPEDPKRFMDLHALMQAHGLSRLQAAELQNHLRDLARAHHAKAGNPGDYQAWFDEALKRVKANQFESGLSAEKLAKARFVVVFDLDETLLEQGDNRKVPDDCRDFTYTEVGYDGKPGPRNVKLNPGWQATFERIRALGGGIALFSANIDDRTAKVVNAWQWEGKPLASHPDILGWMSNSHLTQSRHFNDPKVNGAYDRSANPDGAQRPPRPIIEPSKDLRLFDEDLQRVILVDDNPLRVFQYKNLRWLPKFKAKAVCGSEPNRKAEAERGLTRVTAEITEAVGWLDTHPSATFAQAFLPYSLNGVHAVRALEELGGLSHDQAMAAVRADPGLVEEDF